MVVGVGELDLGGTLEHSVELSLVLREGGTECPHNCEDKVSLIDLLDVILIVCLLEGLNLVVIGLVAVELINEGIDDASKGFHMSHLANWCNLFLSSYFINE